MNASTATADTPLRQANMLLPGMLAGVLATQSVNILLQVCLPPSWLCLPVSPGVSAVSSRTAMNHVGRTPP
ncbi:hypothetical protein NITMOv2_2462 [Nitrospira moscoviensis]|uniref:Uncharacterized protein n=1 Tax=Nitrospira moscoviensis TaxID=42253 RepID=A0A0K2GD41_NITMO|nr:hypothetical protein NITMOv2_2462 [Nitrospira moscoviensis]